MIARMPRPLTVVDRCLPCAREAGVYLALGGLVGCGGDDGSAATMGGGSDGTTSESTVSTTSASGSDAEGSDAENSETSVDPCEVFDVDGDGHGSIACGDDDCDDTDPDISPSAPDGWVHTMVLGPFDRQVGLPSLTIDGNGTLHVVHPRADEAAMDHAWSNDGTSWQTALVDYPAPEALQRVDLTAGPSATLHLAMTGPSGSATYGVFDGRWAFEPLDETGIPAAVTFGDGEVVVATGGGTIARGSAGAWTFENSATAGNARAVDVTTDSSGAIHTFVCNVDAGLGANVGSLFATNETGEWVTTRLISDSFDAQSLAVVTVDDAPHLVTHITHNSLTRLTWYERDGDDWVEELIATFGSGSHGMSAAPGALAPIIAYYASPSGDLGGLEVAEYDGEWSSERIVTGDFAGYDPSVAVADDGTIHVVHRNVESSTLWHSRRGSDGIDQNCDGED
jgi:hypothetical protein